MRRERALRGVAEEIALHARSLAEEFDALSEFVDRVDVATDPDAGGMSRGCGATRGAQHVGPWGTGVRGNTRTQARKHVRACRRGLRPNDRVKLGVTMTRLSVLIPARNAAATVESANVFFNSPQCVVLPRCLDSSAACVLVNSGVSVCPLAGG